MAKVIYGAGVSQMSGKQGGTVFSRNKSGAYTRTNRKGTNPNTPAQQARRAAFADASRTFKALTSVQQQSFKDQSLNYPQIDRLGQTVYLSGSQLAAKYGNLCKLLDRQIDPIEMGAPIYMAAGVGALVAATVVGGVITVLEATYTMSLENGSLSTVVPANCGVVIKATKTYGNGVTAPKAKDFRIIKIIGDTEDTADTNIKTDYQNVFGLNVAAGDAKIFFSFELVSYFTPQSTAPFGYTCLV